MKKENILFLTLAIITVIGIMGIGVAIAERSLSVAAISLLGILIAMRIGFSLKKKLRESDM